MATVEREFLAAIIYLARIHFIIITEIMQRTTDITSVCSSIEPRLQRDFISIV